MTTGKDLDTIDTEMRINNFAINADETLLAVTDYNGRVRFWDLKSKERLGTIQAHENAYLSSLVFFGKEQNLVTANQGIDFQDGEIDGELRLWKIKRRK